jgi:predicted ATPase
MANNWYVITGGPSSGKTTLLGELQKYGYPTIPEMARLVIDDGFARGLTIKEIRKDEQAFQDTVFERKLALEAGLDVKQEAFMDRGLHDSLAYYESLGWEASIVMRAAMDKACYKAIFLLEPLPQFHEDEARTEDIHFTRRLTTLLQDAYIQYGMEPVRVPVLSPAERAQFILDYIQTGERA